MRSKRLIRDPRFQPNNRRRTWLKSQQESDVTWRWISATANRTVAEIAASRTVQFVAIKERKRNKGADINLLQTWFDVRPHFKESGRSNKFCAVVEKNPCGQNLPKRFKISWTQAAILRPVVWSVLLLSQWYLELPASHKPPSLYN